MAIFRGTPKKETLRGTDANDLLVGLAGGDYLLGKGGDDRLYGGAGNDKLDGGPGRDRLFGEAGNDKLIGSSGNDTLYGGTGIDDLQGGAGNDAMQGGDSPDTLKGGIGHDTLKGDKGNDTLDGGAGNDRLFGGAGNDLLKPGSGADFYDGGAGVDFVSYADATQKADVVLKNGGVIVGLNGAAGDTGLGIEGVIGSRFGEDISLFGAGVAYGGGGDDRIIANIIGTEPKDGLRLFRGDDGADELRGATDGVGQLWGRDHFILQYDRGYDRVLFFEFEKDKFLISAAEFKLPASLIGQVLPAEYLAVNVTGTATTATQRLTYDTDSFLLYADLDGNGTNYSPIPIADTSDMSVSFSFVTDFLVIA